MSTFAANVDLAIGYNGEKPVSISDEHILIPSAAGGLSTVSVETGAAEWWTPSDGSKQLSAIARHPSGQTMCVAERRLKATLHVIGAQRRVIQRLVDVCKLQIVDMAYSRDGSKFVTLADAPAHNFSIYTVDPQTEKLTLQRKDNGVPAEHQYTFISFNPRSPTDICTSGGGHLTFWKHDTANNSLTPLEGRVTRPNIRVTCHAWSIVPGAAVAAGTTNGLLLLFSLSTGVGEVAFDFSAPTSGDYDEGVLAAPASAAAIVGIAVTKHHTICLTEDGALRFLASHVSGASMTVAMLNAASTSYILHRVIQVPLVQTASSLAVCQNWKTLLIGCKTSGTLAALDIPGYDQPDFDGACLPDSTDLRARVIVNGVRGPIIGSVFVESGKYCCMLDSSGVLRLCEVASRREEFRIHSGERPSCVAASSVVPVVVVGSENGTIRCYSCMVNEGDGSATLRLLLADNVSKSPIRMIVPHPTLPLAVAVAGDSTLIFLPLSDPVRVFGLTELPPHYEGISSLSWTHEEVSPMFICTANNSSVVLARYPTDPIMSETLCYPPEEIVANSWRTDLPMTTATVVMTTETSILCFGGGVDKETKFFNLDRAASPERKDRDSKPLKMPLAFRDHEKSLVSITLVNSKLLLTAGSDGRIVVRDVSCLISSTPNLREIRKDALAVAPRHVSLLGGVRAVSVAKSQKKMMTVGHDGVALLWSMGAPSELQQQQQQQHQLAASSSSSSEHGPSSNRVFVTPETNFWHTLSSAEAEYPTLPAVQLADEETMDFRDKRRKLALDFDRHHAASEHEKIRKHVAALEGKLRQVFHENEQAADDERVDLLDFVVTAERGAFNEKCSKHIDEMKHDVRMADLTCDYVAEWLRKNRWEAMKQQLTVLEGLEVNPEEPVSVHNFAIPVDSKNEIDTLRKVKFMRRMQERSKHFAAAKAAKQFQLERERLGLAPPVAQPEEDQQPPAEQNDGDDQDDHPKSPTAAELEDRKLPPLLTSKAMAAVSNNLADISDFLYAPRDTFARVRAVMQAILLKSRVHAMRVNFNEKFTALSNEKKQIIAQAKERTGKCRIIQLQLNDKRKLVDCKISTKENPEEVLTVPDEDVPEDRTHDPEYKRKKAQEEAEQERWRRVHGNDDAPERALKAWMDGRLDKEVHEIVAKLDPPDFSDEKHQKYVPQDDWNDEQQKIYREFEKKLEKLIEQVTEQRRVLERDLDSMQKATRDAITKFDAQIKQLFLDRVRISQLCSEAELSRIKLCYNFMDYGQIEAELAAKELHRVELQNKLISAAEATHRFRQKLEAKKQQLAQLKADEVAKERNIKLTPPFSTSEELSRWWFSQQQKRKRGGRARLMGEKKPKAAAAAKADAASFGPVSPDPWEFLEREAFEAAEMRRQEEALIHANGAAVQYPDRPEQINEHVWQDFLDFIDDRASKERLMKKMQEEIQDMIQEDGRLSAVEDELRAMAEDAQTQRDMKQRRLLEALFDVDQLFVFRQGHVEYEQDPFITEYGDAALIDTGRVEALNGDIRTRGRTKTELMKDEAARLRELKQTEWETRHAEYQTRILELECKQLQTLRVTKQMQEFISGGGEDHNERQRAKLREKIQHVRKTMTQRIEDKKSQMGLVKRHTREREIENTMLDEQVNHAESLLDTRRHVHTLHASDGDAELPQRLMRDMRITRRLEDVARAQNEEMAALKQEVDRLRERTFPSFAVVSKRVIGNAGAPDNRPHSTRM